MQLRRLRIHSYRQFVDQVLELPERVTVLVGRNDAGKTGLLNRLIDQHLFERVIHGADRSRVAGPAGAAISFEALWDVSAADYDAFPLRSAFGRDDVRTLDIRFRQDEARSWQYFVNGDHVQDAYTDTGDRPSLRQELNHHALLPNPHYLNVGDQTAVSPSGLLIPSSFEAQFADPAVRYEPLLREHLHMTSEALLLRLAGFRATTRRVHGAGVDEPWSGRPHRSPVAARGVQRGLDNVAARITTLLQRWWKDPDGIRYRLRISDNPHCHEINSFLIDYSVTDQLGLELHGSGLQWFISFIVQMLYIESSPRPLLVTIDEPATPLHPGAQRSVVGLLNSLAPRHQVIYTTHSPFMLDWNFPQRIRVLERDAVTRRTQIINRPYVSSGAAGKLWEPLRASIGTTMGGIASIDDVNVLVEGISDQILLANLSAYLQTLRRSHLDLQSSSILPYGEEISLKQLLRAIGAHNAARVVLVDTDAQGQKAARLCAREGAPVVEIAPFAARAVGAIEDVIEAEDYLAVVNAFYSQFAWFTPIELGTISQEIGALTLGGYFERYFESHFQQTFSKVSVAIALTYEPEGLSAGTLDRMERLIIALVNGVR
jgi:AAA ATPase domain/AAA domain